MTNNLDNAQHCLDAINIFRTNCEESYGLSLKNTKNAYQAFDGVLHVLSYIYKNIHDSCDIKQGDHDKIIKDKLSSLFLDLIIGVNIECNSLLHDIEQNCDIETLHLHLDDYHKTSIARKKLNDKLMQVRAGFSLGKFDINELKELLKQTNDLLNNYDTLRTSKERLLKHDHDNRYLFLSNIAIVVISVFISVFVSIISAINAANGVTELALYYKVITSLGLAALAYISYNCFKIKQHSRYGITNE